jgi:outer membrane protein OmpA-like peptidoglycan-associated protein
MKKLLFSIVAIAGFFLSTVAQEKSRRELQGDKYYFIYAFDNAIDAYNRTKHLTAEGQRRLAESYYNLNLYVESEAAYLKLINTPDASIADDYFDYAMVLKSNGKYDESNTWMDKFRQMRPTDLRARDYVAQKSEFSTLSKDNGKYTVERLEMNTDAEDFGPSYYKNKIVFASSRTKNEVVARKYNWKEKPFFDLYVSDIDRDRDQLKKPSVFDKDLNGKMHEGPASFTKDGNYVAFSRNDYDVKRKDRIVRIQICFSTYQGGKWSEPEPFILNSKEYSVAHPCLSADGNTMYFASDMPGGYGGADIYKIKKDTEGSWGKAENLGDKINTEGDELFPFFEENNEVLFFASNGRYGLGGLDIFICEMRENGRAYNAGAPLNSQYDDFAMIVDNNMSEGYFSTNRNSEGDDDIYSVDLVKDLDIDKMITGIAKDENGNLLPNTLVTLRDDKGNVIGTFITTTDTAGYTFYVEGDKNFKLIGQKDNYLDGTTAVNTSGNEYRIKADVVLRSKREIEDPGLRELTTINPIYFDFDKSNIRPDAETGLNKIIQLMNENPNMVIESRAYADCRGSQQYNQVLSDKRARASVNYIKKRITQPARISGKGYGETNLTSGCTCNEASFSNCSEADHQKDRRTEFYIKNQAFVKETTKSSKHVLLP